MNVENYLSMIISIHALREEGDLPDRASTVPRFNFYPRPPRGGRPWACALWPLSTAISIHALREEGDAMGWLCTTSRSNFYPRPPRGGRHGVHGELKALSQFLSTPSARRATQKGEGQEHRQHISIHALREEGDPPQSSRRKSMRGYFYPRPPRGGRQQKQRQNLYFQTNYTTFCTNLEEP